MIVYVVLKFYDFGDETLLNVFTDRTEALDYAQEYILDNGSGIMVLKMKTDTENPYPYKNKIYKRVV